MNVAEQKSSPLDSTWSCYLFVLSLRQSTHRRSFKPKYSQWRIRRRQPSWKWTWIQAGHQHYYALVGILLSHTNDSSGWLHVFIRSARVTSLHWIVNGSIFSISFCSTTTIPTMATDVSLCHNFERLHLSAPSLTRQWRRHSLHLCPVHWSVNKLYLVTFFDLKWHQLSHSSSCQLQRHSL